MVLVIATIIFVAVIVLFALDVESQLAEWEDEDNS